MVVRKWTGVSSPDSLATALREEDVVAETVRKNRRRGFNHRRARSSTREVMTTFSFLLK